MLWSTDKTKLNWLTWKYIINITHVGFKQLLLVNNLYSAYSTKIRTYVIFTILKTNHYKPSCLNSVHLFHPTVIGSINQFQLKTLNLNNPTQPPHLLAEYLEQFQLFDAKASQHPPHHHSTILPLEYSPSSLDHRSTTGLVKFLTPYH